MAESVAGLALGGVGGFNAHDAGVLKAFADKGVVPDVITCTSGAIFWTYQFLTDPDGIPDEVRRQADRVRARTPCGPRSPAFPASSRRPTPSTCGGGSHAWRRLSPRELATAAARAGLPGHASAADFAAMAAAFTALVDPHRLQRLRHLDRAGAAVRQPRRARVPQGRRRRAALVAERDTPSRYHPIDAATIESALWLTLYGSITIGARWSSTAPTTVADHRRAPSCTVIVRREAANDAWHATARELFEVQDFGHRDVVRLVVRREDGDAGEHPAPAELVRSRWTRPLGYWTSSSRRPATRRGYEAAKALLEADDTPFRAMR